MKPILAMEILKERFYEIISLPAIHLENGVRNTHGVADCVFLNLKIKCTLNRTAAAVFQLQPHVDKASRDCHCWR